MRTLPESIYEIRTFPLYVSSINKFNCSRATMLEAMAGTSRWNATILYLMRELVTVGVFVFEKIEFRNLRIFVQFNSHSFLIRLT